MKTIKQNVQTLSPSGDLYSLYYVIWIFLFPAPLWGVKSTLPAVPILLINPDFDVQDDPGWLGPDLHRLEQAQHSLLLRRLEEGPKVNHDLIPVDTDPFRQRFQKRAQSSQQGVILHESAHPWGIGKVHGPEKSQLDLQRPGPARCFHVQNNSVLVANGYTTRREISISMKRGLNDFIKQPLRHWDGCIDGKPCYFSKVVIKQFLENPVHGVNSSRLPAWRQTSAGKIIPATLCH